MFDLNGDLVEQDPQIRGTVAAFASKMPLFPDTLWSAMVVIAGNDEHRHLDRSDRVTGCRDRGLCRVGGVEQIAGHDDEICPRLSHHVTDPPHGIEAFLLETGAFLDVFHSGEGLSQLPVCGVDEGDHGEGVTLGREGL